MKTSEFINHDIFNSIKILIQNGNTVKEYKAAEKEFKAAEKELEDKKKDLEKVQESLKDAEKEFKAAEKELKDKKKDLEKVQESLKTLESNIDALRKTLFDIFLIDIDKEFLDNFNEKLPVLNKDSTIEHLNEVNKELEQINKTLIEVKKTEERKLRKKLAEEKIDKYETNLEAKKYFYYCSIFISVAFTVGTTYFLIDNDFYLTEDMLPYQYLKLFITLFVLVIFLGLLTSFYQAIIRLNHNRNKITAIVSLSKLLDEKQEKMYVEKYLKSIIEEES